MILGIIGSIVKIIVGILHVWKPEKDNWIDNIQAGNEWIQKNLFKYTKYLYNLGK